MHQENGQNQTLKNTTFPRQMGLFAATVAAVEGNHSRPLADRLDTASAILHTLVITHLPPEELSISLEESAGQPGGEACKSIGRRGNVRGVAQKPFYPEDLAK
jgi:hypothetical protein